MLASLVLDGDEVTSSNDGGAVVPRYTVDLGLMHRPVARALVVQIVVLGEGGGGNYAKIT